MAKRQFRFMTYLINAIILLPVCADLLFIFPLLLNFFNIDLSWYSILSPWFFWYPQFLFTAVLISVLLYGVVLFHICISIFSLKNKFFSSINNFYKSYRSYILTSVILSLSTFISMAFSIIPVMFKYMNSSPDVMILTKFSIIIITILGIQYAPRTKFVTAVGGIIFIMGVSTVVYFLIGIISEFMPHYYLTFPLNDTKAKYIINYDGDYWVTYYEVEQRCTQTPAGTQQCTEVLHKKGNTSITESPIPLDAYKDKTVRIDGEFVRIHGPLSGVAKKLCIGTGIFNKVCKTSTGPGVWYASPLKIHSITVL